MILAHSNRESGVREIFRILRWRLPGGLCVCLLLAGILTGLRSIAGYAQTLDATVWGEIAESSGAIIPKVLIKATNEETGEKRRATSDSDGRFTLSNLSPGLYRLEVEASGFRRYVAGGIQLQIGQNLRLKLSLEPGGPADVQVVVFAKQSLVEPDATKLGAVIENPQIVNLPLDGRNFLELSLLLPGAAPAAQGSPGSVRGNFAVNVNGAREDSNNFVLDGAFNNDPKLNTFAVNPPADGIREFEILTSSYDASFGRSGGAQISMALKSGTNQFHGTAYEFFRNASLDARNFFARSEDGTPRYQRNQFGFSVGGPVRKDRAFFFVDYEGRRMREGITRATNVPTELERMGDFSQSALPPLDPYTQSPFEDGRIPPERISESGKAIAALYPLPNRAVPGQNYISSPILSDRDDHFDVRMDFSLSDKSSLITRYSFSDRELYEPFTGPNFARVPGYGSNLLRRAQNVLIGEDHIFSSTLVNQIRFAVNRVAAGVFQESRAGSLNQQVGLPELSSNPRDFGLSFITVSGFSPVGDEYNNPQHGVTNVFQLSDTVTYSKKRHLIKLGGDVRALQQNAFRDIQARGFLAFSDYGQVTGNGLADLLLGFITYSGGAHLDNPQYLRTESLSFFVQDTYRMGRDFTLQLGLRYEYNSPPVDLYDRATSFDPVSKTLVPVGQGGMPRSVYEPDRNNWAPRLGIAWSPGVEHKTVLRAGCGVYYDQSSLAPGEGLYFNMPYYDFKLYYPLPGFPLVLDDPFPSDYPLSIPGSALGFDRWLRTPYLQQWNLSVERQLGGSSLIEIAYVGSKGSKILSARDINQPAASPVRPNPRPLPEFADITFLESRGNSTYNSFQTRFQQRLRSGTTALVSYTLGKSLDETSTFFSSAGDANFPQDSARPGAEKGRSGFDLRHRLSLSYLFDLPFGRGRKLLANRGFISELLAGWATSGILTFQSGRPFTVALLPEIDNSNTGIGALGFGSNDRPDRIAAGTLTSPTPERWFDTSAFVFADYGSFGNSGRNILDGPGYQDFSVSLAKNSRVRESLDIQFRFELFNAFNHANFDLPDGFLGSPTFGRVNSAQSPRRIQFGLKFIF
jgi:hypothetical protein